MTLNGTWKFNWVKDADSRPTDFWKTGFNDKGWDDLQVPAVWELNGYGDPIYVNVGYAWRNQFQNNPPEVPTENNHVGSYRREIVVPASWKGKDIIAHFGSVTSNMYLWVNGRYVGYSEDSKLEAEFDLTPYLKPGQKNLIAFQVFRWCDGTYLEGLCACCKGEDCEQTCHKLFLHAIILLVLCKYSENNSYRWDINRAIFVIIVNDLCSILKNYGISEAYLE